MLNSFENFLTNKVIFYDNQTNFTPMFCMYNLSRLISLPVLAQQNEKGFLVIAPDRGFMGNQEIRDIHESFSEQYTSSLVFITPEETDRFLNEGIDKLKG